MRQHTSNKFWTFKYFKFAMELVVMIKPVAKEWWGDIYFFEHVQEFRLPIPP